ncbi:MAG: acyl-ACP--UDP-N-acetylglucosamine O-acyltransferase [Deltaproteobacteria bacterium]|nr:acyl-ACP--UDP-N-acetylglucosamine O-acyltransferase [Deltaproteobacteria bacterium]
MGKQSSLKSVRGERKRVVIHPTAVVDGGAVLDDGVDIGPYSIIGGRVKIGAGTRVGPHVVVQGHTTIGADNRIYPFACIGMVPQDSKYNGEPTELAIGDRNTIREYVTINLGTEKGGGTTVIGDDCLIMAYCHLAHDCRLGDRVVFANGVTLAGHVEVGDHVTVGGLSAVHQFARLGKLSFVGGGSMVSQDLPPFMHATGDRARLFGLNVVGLKRRGLSADTIEKIRQAYRLIFRSGLSVTRAIARVRAEVESVPEVTHLVEFVRTSERGVIR